MDSFIINPRNLTEFRELKEYFEKNNIESSIISIKDKEDFALLEFMNESDRNKLVPRDEVMNLLSAEYEG